MEKLSYSASKPLKVKIATRNIAVYRDPAVILIDQLKAIHVEGELEVVDTSIWHAKVARKEYTVGLNLTGVGSTTRTSISTRTTAAIPSATTRSIATRKSTP